MPPNRQFLYIGGLTAKPVINDNERSGRFRRQPNLAVRPREAPDSVDRQQHVDRDRGGDRTARFAGSSGQHDDVIRFRYLNTISRMTSWRQLIGHVAVYGITREADEGAAAPRFQLLLVAQMPVIAYFAIRWLPKAPRQALAVLGLHALAGCLAVASVLVIERFGSGCAGRVEGGCQLRTQPRQKHD